MEETNKIYARANAEGMVIKIFSDVFEQPAETDALIEWGNQDCHAHPHLKYQVRDEEGQLNYKIQDGKLIERTAEEKQAEAAAQPEPLKSRLEILEETVDTLTLSLLEV